MSAREEQDATGRMRELADQLIREQFEGRKFRNACESWPDAALFVREDRVIVWANVQACLTFGVLKSEELVGRLTDELVPPDVRERHAAYMAAYFARPATRFMAIGRSLRACRLTGAEFQAEIALAPLYGETGMLAIAVIRDVTARPSVEVAHGGG